MPDRDELAALIRPHLGHTSGTVGGQWADRQAGEIANAILAAGWRPPYISEAQCEADNDHHGFEHRCRRCGIGLMDYYGRDPVD